MVGEVKGMMVPLLYFEVFFVEDMEFPDKLFTDTFKEPRV